MTSESISVGSGLDEDLFCSIGSFDPGWHEKQAVAHIMKSCCSLLSGRALPVKSDTGQIGTEIMSIDFGGGTSSSLV